MSWWRKEPGHQHTWYWPNYPGTNLTTSSFMTRIDCFTVSGSVMEFMVPYKLPPRWHKTPKLPLRGQRHCCYLEINAITESGTNMSHTKFCKLFASNLRKIKYWLNYEYHMTEIATFLKKNSQTRSSDISVNMMQPEIFFFIDLESHCLTSWNEEANTKKWPLLSYTL